jgi:hypothetical protein
MRRRTLDHFARAAACILVAQGCTSYGPQLEPLHPSDRFRIVADSPFAITTAGRDRVPAGRCRATEVTGRVLDVRGDTLVVGGPPIIVPAPGTGCDVAATVIFVAPEHPRDVEVRRPDAAKTVWALSGAAFLLYMTALLLEYAFPET